MSRRTNVHFEATFEGNADNGNNNDDKIESYATYAS
jgi:hypothetical protein